MSGTDDILALLLAFGGGVLSTALLRLIGGAGTGARIAGVGLPIGFLTAWSWFAGFDFPPEGTFGLTAYIALGGLCLGIILDAMAVRKGPRLLTTVCFVGLCVWLALGSPDRMPGTPVTRIELVLAAVILVVSWLGLLTRLKADHVPGRGADGVMLILLLGLGLGLIALQAEAQAVAGPCLALAMAGGRGTDGGLADASAAAVVRCLWRGRGRSGARSVSGRIPAGHRGTAAGSVP